MGNIFQEVKDRVSARQAAEYCGISIGRNGMACCPFHNDTHPSMKIDKRYYCFACGAKGDAIDFVANYKGLSMIDAAKELADAFGIRYEDYSKKRKPPPEKRAYKAKKQERSLEDRYKDVEKHCYRVLCDYYHTLKHWKECYAPKTPEDAYDERFVETLQNLSHIEYLLDILLGGSTREKMELIIDYGKKVTEIERRFKPKGASIGNDRAA